MSFLLLILSACWQLAAQIPRQTVRGTVIDAANAMPLASATVAALRGDTLVRGTVSDADGRFRMDSLPVGRYQLQVSYLGYGTLTLQEILLEAGRQVVLTIRLQTERQSLAAVVVPAQAALPAELPGTRLLTVEDQFRFPSTFNDPARLVMAYPGVAGQQDGTNLFAVRGNGPNAVKWRLEGVEIVNPNHSANAGTFSDRPTQAGGGVNILSPQLLATSNFMTGAFPSGYDNATGAILDMQLRNGNDQLPERTRQIGFIGLEYAAEGPFRKNPTADAPAYLLNYRYSFTGLLTGLGVDFGDEDNRFQDFSFSTVFPTRKAGRLSVFGLGGNSSTRFRGEADSTRWTSEKSRLDIDFRSAMGAVGATHVLPVGRRSVLRTTALWSGLSHRRWTNPAGPAATSLETDSLRECKTALSIILSGQPRPRWRFRSGFQLYRETFGFRSDFQLPAAPGFSLSGDLAGWRWLPFADLHRDLSPRWRLEAGCQVHHFSFDPTQNVVSPRLALHFRPNQRHSVALSAGRSSQTPMAQLYALPRIRPKGLGFQRSWQYSAAYRLRFGTGAVLLLEPYLQRTDGIPVSTRTDGLFSAANVPDFSAPSLGEWILAPDIRLTADGRARNYGLDASFQHYLTERFFLLLSGSLYRSEHTRPDGTWGPTRYDGRHLLHVSTGREFVRQKGKLVRTWGLSGRASWLGGMMDTPIDVEASREQGFTVYDPERPFGVRLADYARMDLRLYLRRSRDGRNSLLSLDLQNLTGRRNAQYHYYDPVLDRVELKKQLGLIPILTWRTSRQAG
jgi:hypothetical protein